MFPTPARTCTKSSWPRPSPISRSKKHHGAKVLLHLVVRHGDGIKIVDVTETEAEMRELEEFMFAALDHHGIKRPEVQIYPVHKLQTS
jgi:hypothetical protein